MDITTSAVTVLSSAHGRQRRSERDIAKRDLQAAVRYGEKTPSHPCPRTGNQRWIFTFADIVYVTDETCSREITSWPALACGIDIEKVDVTDAMQAEHRKAIASLSHTANWTSHTVVVVDQSGSMRNPDVEGHNMRCDVVWVELALEFVAKRLKSGEACANSDVFSVVGMSSESTVLLECRPMDWILYNDLIELLRTKLPKGDGVYAKAFDKAEELLSRNRHGSCALLLLFLSDGHPSDRGLPHDCHHPHSRKRKLCTDCHVNHLKKAWMALARERGGRLASRFGRRLTIGGIGIGPPDEDHCALRALSEAPGKYGGQGFSLAAAPLGAPASLALAFSHLSSAMSATMLELTAAPGGVQRAVRDVRREPARHAAPAGVEQIDAWSWWVYIKKLGSVTRAVWDRDAGWATVGFATPGAAGVALTECFFGEGAERLVRRFREIDAEGKPIGPALVAKDNRDLKEFHKAFCKTQLRAQDFARVFNEKLATVPGVNQTTPRILFLECSVYMVTDKDAVRLGVLVEKRLDAEKYTKWNSNNGFVASGRPAVSADGGVANLAGIIEAEEDGSDEGGALTIDAQDIPQAFSHFTCLHSNWRLVVCDLQGVLDAAAVPPVFEMTDPAIHRKSDHAGEKPNYGRSDRGLRGIHNFFKTHVCSELCKRLQKRWLRTTT